MWPGCVPETTRLLTRHFFRRFIENDLISPDSDRHQTLAVVSACIVSFVLVVTMLLAVKYLAALPTPGQVALLSLDDKFLYIGWSMAAMALVTLAEWDALALDVRDASILGPLPIPGRTIFQAKAAALLMFAGGSIVVLNLVPTIIFSSAMVSKLIVGPVAFIALVATHAATTVAAGAFGFLSVLAVRELLHAVLGTATFRRISTAVQVGLVVIFVTALCLLPGFSSRVGRSYLAPERMTYKMPPLWFLGLYETGAGHVMDDLSRAQVPRRLMRFDREATEVYRSRKPVFGPLAVIAVSALGLVGLIALVGYTINNRHLPSAVTAQQDVPHRIRRLSVALAERFIVQDPLSRAGFFFTLQTLFRSGTHRLSMAISVALALACTTVALQGVDVQRVQQMTVSRQVLTGVLAVQAMVILVLLMGFRHAARVPAELLANWAFQLCWAGECRPYVRGVKRAAFLCVLCPALLMLLPLHTALLGVRLALVHSLCGLAFAFAALEIVMLGFRTLPFASGYVAGGNLKGWLAIGIVGFWPLTRIIAGLERVAIRDVRSTVAFLAGLALMTVAARMLDRWQRQSYGPVDFYELPAQAQRLDLTI
jgi:hypothetical protein